MQSSIPPAEVEPVPCALCGETASAPHARKDGYTIVRCLRCGLVYVSPRPSRARLRALYEDASYFAGGEWYDDYLADADNHRRLFARVMDRLDRFAPGRRGRMLDVGCAAGFLLEAARARGREVVGVEPSPAMADHARRVLGIEVRGGSILEAGFGAGELDVVAFCDSIEHLPDPVESLREAHRILAPGGSLLVVTPNVASPLARLMGRSWPHFTPREHILYFDPATLARLFAKTGFVVVHRQSIGHYLRVGAIARKLGLGGRAVLELPGIRSILRRSVYLNVGDLLMIGRARE
jgi:SAM-dependent methyltransferase